MKMVDAKTFNWLTKTEDAYIDERFADEHSIYSFRGMDPKGFELKVNGKTVCKSLAKLKKQFAVKEISYRRKLKLPFTAKKPYCLVYMEEWHGGDTGLAIKDYDPSKLKFLIETVPVPGKGVYEYLSISGYDGEHGLTDGTEIRLEELSYFHIVDKNKNRYGPKFEDE